MMSNYKKFTDVINVSDYEIETDTGWEDIKTIGKTISYQVWKITTENFSLQCANNHIVFDENMNEIFVKDLNITNKIQTKNGLEKITNIEKTNNFIEMYDLELQNNSNRRFYTSGILSHNSLWLSNLACNSVRNGYNTAIITLEMSDKKFIKRLGSNLLNIPIQEYEEWSRDTQRVKKALSNFNKLDGQTMQIPGKLFIKQYPTSSAGVPDIENWLKKVEEIKREKIKVVVVDYINILKNWRNPNSENTYMKIKQIAEDLRAMAINNDWSIISCSQVNREGFKNSDLDMDNISESVGLIATVDALFGINKDPIDQGNNQYKINAIALRDAAGIGEYKYYNTNLNYMRITETMEQNEEIDEFTQ